MVTGEDEERIPPGQRLTRDFPVLHAGSVVRIDPKSFVLALSGLVEPHTNIAWEQLLSYPAIEETCDIHCVTGWTKLDTTWKGVRISDLFAPLQIAPEARHALIRARGGWTTNLPLEELMRADVLAVYEYDGRPLSEEHGGPVRLLVPRLYFWKSAKWLERIELTADQRLGYWETRGYHELGDPWLEQRYS
jgi:DMSO/TMAO reductase YedYZ molybdopterin-dependent catalytic subunit